MDSGVITLLSGGAGAIGVLVGVLILIVTGVLVPKPYVTKYEERIQLLERALESEKKINDELAAASALNNQMIGALRQIAIERVRETKEHQQFDINWDSISRDDGRPKNGGAET